MPPRVATCTGAHMSDRPRLSELPSAYLAELSIGYLALARDAALAAIRESFVRLAIRYAVMADRRETEEIRGVR
jgi:hypothetical protein